MVGLFRVNIDLRYIRPRGAALSFGVTFVAAIGSRQQRKAFRSSSNLHRGPATMLYMYQIIVDPLCRLCDFAQKVRYSERQLGANIFHDDDRKLMSYLQRIIKSV